MSYGVSHVGGAGRGGGTVCVVWAAACVVRGREKKGGGVVRPSREDKRTTPLQPHPTPHETHLGSIAKSRMLPHQSLPPAPPVVDQGLGKHLSPIGLTLTLSPSVGLYYAGSPYGHTPSTPVTRVTAEPHLKTVSASLFTKGSWGPTLHSGVGLSHLVVVDLREATALRTLGSRAFSTFPKLTTVCLPPSVTTIGPACFTRSKLASLDFLSQTKVGAIEPTTFAECENLNTLRGLPSSVKSLGERAFEGCHGLTLSSLKHLSPDVKIHQHAFQNCSALTLVLATRNFASVSAWQQRRYEDWIRFGKGASEAGSDAHHYRLHMSWPAGPDELRTQAGSEAHARVPALFEVLTHSCRSDSQIRVEDAADSTRGRRP